MQYQNICTHLYVYIYTYNDPNTKTNLAIILTRIRYSKQIPHSQSVSLIFASRCIQRIRILAYAIEYKHVHSVKFKCCINLS